jgi:hypothetical protein
MTAKKKSSKPPHQIGTLNEKPLHAALKKWYRVKGDSCEVLVDGFHIDLVRGDTLVEIQTRNFSAMKRKLWALTKTHKVRLVHPVPSDRWIVKLPKSKGEKESRRKSPKHGSVYHLFDELVHIPTLIHRDTFSLEVLITKEEEIRRHDPKRGWRRKGWMTEERRLLEVSQSAVFESLGDLLGLIPDTVPDQFTTADLAIGISHPRPLAQKMAYCLREMGAIDPVGKTGNAIIYSRVKP